MSATPSLSTRAKQVLLNPGDTHIIVLTGDAWSGTTRSMMQTTVDPAVFEKHVCIFTMGKTNPQRVRLAKKMRADTDKMPLYVVQDASPKLLKDLYSVAGPDTFLVLCTCNEVVEPRPGIMVLHA